VRYLLEFTGDHPTLPLEELKASAEAVGEHFTLIDGRGLLAIVDSEDLTRTMERCALLRTVSIFIERGRVEGNSLVGGSGREQGHGITDSIVGHVPDAGSFRVTPRKHRDKFPGLDISGVVRSVAGLVDLPVSLHDPDVEIIIFLSIAPTPPHSGSPVSYSLGLKLFENQRTPLHERAVRYRPFFSPISLPPIFARMLINLSRVSKDGILLDPFCGTGGVLLESSFLGPRTIGTDLDGSMLAGAARNLEHFSINAELARCDIGNLRETLGEMGVEQVDGIATDMPYGRASTTFGEGLGELTDRMLDSFDEVLRPGGYVALVSSTTLAARPEHGSLRLVSCHRLKVHGSLNRHFIVLRKID
jgi:putative methyltransferase (TIGR01177 family)